MKLILIEDSGALRGVVNDVDNMIAWHSADGGNVQLALTPVLRQAIITMFNQAWAQRPEPSAAPAPIAPYSNNVIPFQKTTK